MPPRTRPPFRADHVGSLLRPPRLMQARADHAEGTISAAELRAVEDECIREAVAMQRDVGLRSATDGEFRRASWHMDYIYQLGGVSQVEGERIHVKFRNDEGEYDFAPPAMRVDGPVRIEHTIFGDAFAFLRDTVAGATPKLTIPSPSMVHYRGGNSAIDPAVYPDLDAFWTDLVTRLRRRGGAPERARMHLSAARRHEPRLRQRSRPARAHHWRSAATRSTCTRPTSRNINRALAGRPDGLAVTTHMCRGNAQSMWAAEGCYDFVAEALFSDLEVDGFFLEYDDARSGGFEPLRFVPAGQVRGARPRHHQAAAARGEGCAQAPDRAGRPLRRHRPAVPLAPVRLLVDRRGQPAHDRRGDRQAAAGGRDRRGGVGVGVRPRGGAAGSTVRRAIATSTVQLRLPAIRRACACARAGGCRPACGASRRSRGARTGAGCGGCGRP